jgi:DNA-binding LacI/PurR family transcriptional regulator
VAKITKPVQRDIARMAEVSQAAVSMVVSGKADENGIPESTQERIRVAIRELGYVPNVAARSLRGGRNGLIGVHTFERVFPVNSDDYYNEFLIGIEEQAVALGQDLVLFASTQGSDGTRSIYGSGSNRLNLTDGAVILGIEKNDDELERLSAEGFPFVFIGRRDVPGVPYVTAGYYAATGGVVRELVDHGHRAIAYLGASRRKNPQEERRAGFNDMMTTCGLTASQEKLCEPGELTDAWLRALIEGGTTAIVIEDHESAVALGNLAEAVGVIIPDQLSTVTLDGAPRAEAPNPWSHLTVPRRELGRRAVAVLVALLDGSVAADHFEVIPCEPPLLTTITQAKNVLELESTLDPVG